MTQENVFVACFRILGPTTSPKTTRGSPRSPLGRPGSIWASFCNILGYIFRQGTDCSWHLRRLMSKLFDKSHSRKHVCMDKRTLEVLRQCCRMSVVLQRGATKLAVGGKYVPSLPEPPASPKMCKTCTFSDNCVMQMAEHKCFDASCAYLSSYT